MRSILLLLLLLVLLGCITLPTQKEQEKGGKNIVLFGKEYFLVNKYALNNGGEEIIVYSNRSFAEEVERYMQLEGWDRKEVWVRKKDKRLGRVISTLGLSALVEGEVVSYRYERGNRSLSVSIYNSRPVKVVFDFVDS